jgi:Rrf2 family nitric oxide-sensitive transcriptional repressor
MTLGTVYCISRVGNPKLGMISTTAEYALRATAHLAMHPRQSCTTQQIAQATRVPAGYLSKVLQELVRAGLANSQRGPSGGFTLARPPHVLTVLDVINAVDPVERIRECPLRLAAHGRNLCVLHQRLDDALSHVERLFARSTIAEMIRPSRSGSRCLFPTLDGGPESPAPSGAGRARGNGAAP